MPKPKSGAKKGTAPAKVPGRKQPASRLGLLKSASQRVAAAAAKLVKTAKKQTRPAKPAAKAPPPAPARAAGLKTAPGKATPPTSPRVDRPRPRATKLPAVAQPLTKREMEHILTAASGRGVSGEGSLKGRLVLKEGFPHLHVVGRDKRELVFVLQGPDQEVLPAYVDHKVSVSGLIRKTHNYGGTVDVRKYSAKKTDAEHLDVPPPAPKLRFLSPGEVEQVGAAGMGAGMHGFANMRGQLEMSGEAFMLVCSNSGTRHQVSFLLLGKLGKSLRKHVGHTVLVTGVVDKESGWGGKVEVEAIEPRPNEFRGVSRANLEVVEVDGSDPSEPVEVRLNHGLSVRMPERAGYTWAIEPTTAKRLGLREALYEPASAGPGQRAFFFTPRNPGMLDVDFYLAKVFSPAQVLKTYRLNVTVRP